MTPAQRKDDILHAELPPTLPLMALRSTIVYPLGTIAVQMGAPENLSLLKANEQSGLIVGLVLATGEKEMSRPEDSSGGLARGSRARAINLPVETVRSHSRIARLIVEGVAQPSLPDWPHQASMRSRRPNEVDDLISRIFSGRWRSYRPHPDDFPAIPGCISDPGRFADGRRNSLQGLHRRYSSAPQSSSD